jgi:hypothetical protein
VTQTGLRDLFIAVEPGHNDGVVKMTTSDWVKGLSTSA